MTLIYVSFHSLIVFDEQINVHRKQPARLSRKMRVYRKGEINFFEAENLRVVHYWKSGSLSMNKYDMKQSLKGFRGLRVCRTTDIVTYTKACQGGYFVTRGVDEASFSTLLKPWDPSWFRFFYYVGRMIFYFTEEWKIMNARNIIRCRVTREREWRRKEDAWIRVPCTYVIMRRHQWWWDNADELGQGSVKIKHERKRDGDAFHRNSRQI
jgi:hypothetical protein